MDNRFFPRYNADKIYKRRNVLCQDLEEDLVAAALDADPADRDMDPADPVDSAAPDPAALAAGIICLPPDRTDPTMAAVGTGRTATAAAAAAPCR